MMDSTINLNSLAFDLAPIGIVLTEHRVICAANEMFADLTGHNKDALEGMSFRTLYDSPREYEDFRDIGLEALQRGETYTDERLLAKQGGVATWCRFRARTLTPSEPLARVVMTYAAISDVSSGVRLTPREREVVLFLSQGKTSKEIAIALGLSPRTIEDVRARLLKKLQVRNVTELLSKLSRGDF